MELPEWLLQEIGRMHVENLYLRRELGEARAHERGESVPTEEPQRRGKHAYYETGGERPCST